MLRRHEEGWKILKSSAKSNLTGIIKLQVTRSTTETVIKKHASTTVRGMQKEKYNDGTFRREFPDALLTSDIDYATSTVTITLNLNNPTSLEDI